MFWESRWLRVLVRALSCWAAERVAPAPGFATGSCHEGPKAVAGCSSLCGMVGPVFTNTSPASQTAMSFVPTLHLGHRLNRHGLTHPPSVMRMSPGGADVPAHLGAPVPARSCSVDKWTASVYGFHSISSH